MDIILQATEKELAEFPEHHPDTSTGACKPTLQRVQQFKKTNAKNTINKNAENQQRTEIIKCQCQQLKLKRRLKQKLKRKRAKLHYQRVHRYVQENANLQQHNRTETTTIRRERQSERPLLTSPYIHQSSNSVIPVVPEVGVPLQAERRLEQFRRSNATSTTQNANHPNYVIYPAGSDVRGYAAYQQLLHQLPVNQHLSAGMITYPYSIVPYELYQ